jgi:ribosomal protein L34
MKRTYQPSNRSRKSTHCFRADGNSYGRKVLLVVVLKGERPLCVNYASVDNEA